MVLKTLQSWSPLWQALEKIITDFPYKNKDANNRPATLRAKQMSNKGSRRVIGTFAELSNLIRSITQLLFNHIKLTNDPFWLWLLQIRHFLRFMLMPKLTNSQVSIPKNDKMCTKKLALNDDGEKSDY